MKLKDGFVLREEAGRTVVVPTGGELNQNMKITLNDTGALLWKQLERETDEAALVAVLLSEYNVDERTARAHVRTFVKELYERDFFE